MLKSKVLLFFSMFVILLSIYKFYDDTNNKMMNSLNNLAIEKLKNDTYYFPAKKFSDSTLVYQPLKQFDFIFTGHDVNLSEKHFDIYENTSALVPGRYTHILMYIGKDSRGFAYALEMNSDENKTFSMDFDGMYIGGGFYLTCLGNDFGEETCSEIDVYGYGFKTYDYFWAKRLNPKLKRQLLLHKDQLFASMQKDLINNYPFQIPFHLDMMTPINKVSSLIEDEHKNGSDCISYFISLFEEVAGVCFDDIRIDASSLMSYYLNDPLGKRAYLPEKYNPTSEKDILIKELLGDLGFCFTNNKPRQTLCSDRKIVTGISTPDLLFNSSSMIDIKPLLRKR